MSGEVCAACGASQFCDGCASKLSRIEGLENDIEVWARENETMRNALEAIRFHVEHVAPNPDVAKVAARALDGLPPLFAAAARGKGETR